MQVLTGITPDISQFLQFMFYKPVYFATGDSLSYAKSPSFPSDSHEDSGFLVGFGENVGDALTFKVLTKGTSEVIFRSSVRSALTEEEQNRRADPSQGETDPHQVPEILKFPKRLPIDAVDPDDDDEVAQGSDATLLHLDDAPDVDFDEYEEDPINSDAPKDDGSDETEEKEDNGDEAPTEDGKFRFSKNFNPAELIGRTYLSEEDKDGNRYRVKIKKQLGSNLEKARQLPENTRFRVAIKDKEKTEKIVTYNEIIDALNEQQSRDLDPDQTIWKFEKIVGHKSGLKPGDEEYMGSSTNVQVEWGTGEITPEPLQQFGKDAPEACAMYAKENGLLNEAGWKKFRRLARREKVLQRRIKQAKLKSYRTQPIYMYGYQVPRTPEEALRFDEENGNTKWADSMALELSQLEEYKTFVDLGVGASPPDPSYKKIRVTFVFAVKADGRHKSRLCARGDMTAVPLDSVYSGVVSLRSLRTVIFAGELNGLEIWGGDVGNAYLEAHTQEKVYIIAGKGFGDLEGHTLLISKALYGLRTSGLRWHERFSDTLRDMGYFPSKGDPDVWMKKVDNVWEYIAVYVDDLAIASKNPKAVCDLLIEKYGYKLKGVGPLKFHLGCDFGRDDDGTMFFGPQKYIERMADAFQTLFPGEKVHKYSTPLEKNDHPELDESEILGDEEKSKYMSMIGALQWVVSLGRLDICTAVVTMSRFRQEPRKGHLDRCKRIYGYLFATKHAAIRVRTDEPDYSKLEPQNYDWMYSVYGNVKELVPEDAPEPLGKAVTTSTYVDANLYHCLVTGRAVTGIMHLFNGTVSDWFSKRQATVETATYGSEFTAARIATEQIIDIRTTLRYFGIPVNGPAYMFGDNQSVVTSSTLPHSGLNKRWNALSYHRVREAIAAGILKFYHISGKLNPADMLSKHIGGHELYELSRPILFHKGDTMKCVHSGEYKEFLDAQDQGECQQENKDSAKNVSKEASSG